MRGVRLVGALALLSWTAGNALATDIPEKDWEYSEIDDDSVAIYSEDQSRRASAIDPATEGDIEVPGTLRQMRVVSIGENAFYGCSGITSVVIPEGVTNIASSAFYGCTSLTNVVFPLSLKTIGNNVFSGCSSLKEVSFSGHGQLTMGSGVFSRCSGLKNFSFVGDSISIGQYAFGKCTSLTNLNLAAKTIEIAKDVTGYYYYDYVYEYYSILRYCNQLANVTLIATNSLKVGENAFNDCYALSNVNIVADNKASIAAGVFSDCSKLKDITLPTSLTEVSSNLFYQCSSLASISFTTNLRYIARRAFDSCTSLTNVNISEGLTTIEEQAFYGCTALNELNLPQSLALIGSRAFEKCALQKLVITGGDTNIYEAASLNLGERAFYKCDNLSEVQLPLRLTSLPERVFADCEALATINLPSNLTTIANSAFESCTDLLTIVFPTNLLVIGDSAFKDCTSFDDFEIPTNNVVEIGSKAFYNTKFWNDCDDDSLVVNNGYILGFKGNPTAVTLPDSCKSLPDGIFEGMSNLVSVTLPAGLTSIGRRAFVNSGIRELIATNVSEIGGAAFSDCSSLKNIVLSESLTVIPAECFKDCISLVDIYIPSNVTTIGAYAFYGCSSLVEVEGGKGVTSVGDYAFAWCTSLNPFEFAQEVAFGEHVFQGCNWTEHVLFPSVGTLKDEYPTAYTNIRSVVFSANANSIVENACLDCWSLECLTIPSSVKTIGDNAFSGCSGLTSVVFAASISSLGTNVFHNCSGIVSVTLYGDRSVKSIFPELYYNLADIKISEGAASLCDDMFVGCAKLTDINIPSTINSIGDSAFASCAALKNVYFPTESIEEDADAKDGFLGNEIEIGEEAFSNCTSLIEVELPLGIKTLSDGLFAGCISLTDDSLEIPYTVTEIGERAFANCTGLTGITIPEKVTTIGDYAFCGCTNLKIVRYLGAKPTVGENIYKYTKSNLSTGWNSREYSSWKGTTGSPWTSYHRTIASWNASKLYPSCKLTFNYYNGKDGIKEVVYIKGRVLGWLMADPTDGYGWWTQKMDGNKYGQYKEIDRAVKLYAHWSASSGSGSASEDEEDDGDDESGDDDEEDESEDDEDEDEEEKVITGGSDVEWGTGFYDGDQGSFSHFASVFDGYLLDADGNVAGTFTFKNAKGKKLASGGTNSTFSVTIQRLGAKSKVTLKGTVDEEGKIEVEKGNYSFSAELTQFGLTGEFEDSSDTGGSYTIFAARNRYSAASDDAKYVVRMARAAAVGNWMVILKTGDIEDLGGGAMANGYSTLSVSVASSGKAKVTGMMADGTKVSVTSTLIVGDGCCCLPVVVPLYASKKGGFGFAIWFTWQDDMSIEDGDISIQGLSGWDASMNKSAAFTAEFESAELTRVESSALSGTASFSLDDSFEIENMEIAEEFLPTDTEIVLKGSKLVLPKADKVKFVRDEGWVNQTEDSVNPAALKLTYNAKTGIIKGQFKVYCVTESGKSKTYTATVNGAMCISDDAFGYGTATIKKLGSVPISIK